MSNLKVGRYELHSLDLTAKPIMERYLYLLEMDTSDYTFAANYLWISKGSGFYSIIEDTFCFFLLSNGELSMLLPPIGKLENCLKAVETCFAIMEENNQYPAYTKIEYIDEKILSALAGHLEKDAEIFDLFEDYVIERSFSDYIYHCDDLIKLSGNSYKNKRNEINKFISIHPNHELQLLNTRDHGDNIMVLLDKWISERMKYLPNEQSDAFLDGIYDERFAIKRMLRDYEALELIGLVIIIDGVLSGFTVGEKINNTTASVIIEKTDFNILGCAQFIFREFAKLLSSNYDVIYINVGDDMGFENLKKVKLSYRPTKMLPKYTIYKRH
ncbi:DUF2156 domain-containing protein [Aliikangiella sp. IMCC44359]|uniref:DUF2156 domain-containing protein n=1 Tax=Aliikangiella sp. IMCC44359 TaxID=3459125 RepID=UPI00403ACD30